MFPEDKHAKFGRRSQCIECRRAYHRANSKLYYAKHRDAKIAKVVAYEKELRAKGEWRSAPFRSTPEFMEKERLRGRKRRQDVSGNPHRAFLTRRYLARKFNAQGYCTKEQLRWRWEYYGNRCWICNSEATETDHVIPLSKGGTNWPANLRPICKPCNVRKSNTWPYKPLPIGV